jgi:hypothetical protein
MRRPSPKCILALTSKEPGTVPPTSAQWPLDWAKAMISSSTKIGRMMRTSLKWVPPRYGSFMAKTSPGLMSSSKASITALAVKCSVPTWTAMSWLPCITVFPCASQSALEKSLAQITNEWQVLRICSAISSTTVTKEFFRTSKVTGSRVCRSVTFRLPRG